MTIQYIAGFFDGEGCVNIFDKKGRGHAGVENHLRCTISQRSRKVLEEIIKYLGYGSICKNRNCWLINFYTRKAERFLKEVLPYLVVKQLQARFALQFQARKEGSRYMIGRRGKLPLSSKEIRWREMHRQLVKILNNRR